METKGWRCWCWALGVSSARGGDCAPALGAACARDGDRALGAGRWCWVVALALGAVSWRRCSALGSDSEVTITAASDSEG